MVLDENILKFELPENSKLEFPVIHSWWSEIVEMDDTLFGQAYKVSSTASLFFFFGPSMFFFLKLKQNSL
jgi:hypothetical protein